MFYMARKLKGYLYKRSEIRASILIKFLLIFGLFLMFGLPIERGGLSYAVLVGVFLVLVAKSFLIPRKMTILLLFCLFIARSLLPSVVIEEGHNVFLPKYEVNELTYQDLPEEVYLELESDFFSAYPKKQWCEKNATGCWRGKIFPKSTWAYSADAFWSPDVKYSRTVNKIEFTNVRDLNPGFMNNSHFHKPNASLLNLGSMDWWVQENNPNKYTAPFFVMYEISHSMVGGELEWRGKVMWENFDEKEKFSILKSENTSSIKKTIKLKDVGNKIYGIASRPIPNIQSALQMKFTPHLGYRVFLHFQYLIVILILGIFALSIKVYRYPFLAFVTSSFILALIYLFFVFRSSSIKLSPSWPDQNITSFQNFSNDIFMWPRTDGLTHKGFGRLISYNLQKGNVYQALKGEESAFYFMPGLRYFRAIELMVWGEQDVFRLFLLACFLSVLLYTIFCNLKIVPGIFLTSIFLLPEKYYSYLWSSSVFNFNFKAFFDLFYYGFAESYGYVFFLLALSFAMKCISNQTRKNMLSYLVATGVLFSLAVFSRPNLVVSGFFVTTFLIYKLASKRQFSLLGVFLLSFFPSLFMLIHNLYFSGQAVLFTTASSSPANLFMTPQIYVDGFLELLGTEAGDNFEKILIHIRRWGSWFGLAVFVNLFVVVFRKNWSENIKLLSVAAIGSHVPLFFWWPDGRYSYLAWLLSLIVFTYSIQIIWQRTGFTERCGVTEYLVKLRKIFRKIIFPQEQIMGLFKNLRFENALDVGAGTGMFLELLHSNHIIKKGVGVEVQERYFTKLSQNLEIVPQSTLSGKYDLIVFNDVLHHVKNKKEMLSFYLENYLQDGGYVLVKDMNPRNFIYKYFNKLHDLVFAGEAIDEIAPDKLQEIIPNTLALVEQGEKRIFLYDHYFLLFKLS